MEEADYKGVTYSVDGIKKTMKYENGYGIVNIAANKTAVISGIPVGTMVDIAEDAHDFHEKVSITPNTSTEITIDKETGEPGVESEVVNKRKLGELDLSKVIDYKSGVSAEAGDEDVTFPFTVTLTSTDFNIADYITTGNPGGTAGAEVPGLRGADRPEQGLRGDVRILPAVQAGERRGPEAGADGQAGDGDPGGGRHHPAGLCERRDEAGGDEGGLRAGAAQPV